MNSRYYNKVDSVDIYDIIRSIKDPELPNTLEELNVVQEDNIEVEDDTSCDHCSITILFKPTVPHCHLAPTIALCLRQKIEKQLPKPSKVTIYIKPGTHQTEDEINKQINDKERYMAALETPEISELVDRCIQEDE
ncbi:hypothetical protein SAMD00019534_066000 [Acytostelium subglobosum LB1]|uniref:hypothetical protein n=1 Tax=Acytostelium subglobosum LB1 TaxID=1410327 RepID=UPI000644EBBB|nr:hypothetical protein SAMD00019534_066000 [Acytostelium subglobosum LB1]GAM23425.1 hypothetical protein SAMD00019534_066000 [Acytostelium subglobosum LB1]|eukprot:XP_012753874.1 hypothetical protein SAMD00019534_066000 [Acytostelium subglobosum LB1]